MKKVNKLVRKTAGMQTVGASPKKKNVVAELEPENTAKKPGGKGSSFNLSKKGQNLHSRKG